MIFMILRLSRFSIDCPRDTEIHVTVAIPGVCCETWGGIFLLLFQGHDRISPDVGEYTLPMERKHPQLSSSWEELAGCPPQPRGLKIQSPCPHTKLPQEAFRSGGHSSARKSTLNICLSKHHLNYSSIDYLMCYGNFFFFLLISFRKRIFFSSRIQKEGYLYWQLKTQHSLGSR